MNCSALQSLLHLLSSPKESIKKEACWTISNITAGNRAQIQVMLPSLFFYPCMRASLCARFTVCMCVWCCWRPEEGIESPGTGITGSHKYLWGLEPNLGPLKSSKQLNRLSSLWSAFNMQMSTFLVELSTSSVTFSVCFLFILMLVFCCFYLAMHFLFTLKVWWFTEGRPQKYLCFQSVLMDFMLNIFALLIKLYFPVNPCVRLF